MSITISQIGADAYWTGASVEIGVADVCPEGWTRQPLPSLAEGEGARWDGRGWLVTSAAGRFAARKDEKLAVLAARRWRAETGGIVFMTMAIKTDEDTQRKITGAYVQADKNPAFTARWKMDAGVFVTLNAATIIAIGDAVTAHIQTCFDKEADLSDLITAAEDEAALEAIDIETGWPS